MAETDVGIKIECAGGTPLSCEGRQLFVDNYVKDQVENLRYIMHQQTKHKITQSEANAAMDKGI